MGSKKRNSLGLTLAAIHLAAFIATAVFVGASPAEQIQLIWLLWFPIDLPWSLLHLFAGAGYSEWQRETSNSLPIVGYVLYLPHLVHGVLGTIWWYYVPRMILYFKRRRASGAKQSDLRNP